MPGDLKEFCEVVIINPSVMAVIFSLLFAAIGTVALAGINGRLRLWKKMDEKADKSDFYRLEKRVYDLAQGKPQDPLPPEVLATLVNNKK